MKALLPLLFIGFSAFGQVDTNKLERTYKTQIILGSVSLGGAVGCVAGFIHLRNTDTYYANGQEVNFKRQARIVLAFGGFLTGVSIFSLVKGAKNRQKYIELTTTGNSVTMLLRF